MPVAPAQVRCTPDDPRLVELSGMVVVGDEVLAVSDGGAPPQVVHLDRDCATTATTTADVDPYDVEDLALGPAGTLWLADTGDNRRSRDTVAVLVLDSTEPGEVGVTLYRLTYPDGPHDAEALLVDREGRPLVVTKELGGTAGVYAPTAPLATPGPTPMAQVGAVTIPPTQTSGGPLGPFGSTVVTGGAVAPDGTAVALRTYTDAYVFDAPDGDLVAALGRTPLQVPLPDEPQGEAVALTADGTLLAAGERARGATAPLRVVPGVVQAARAPRESPSQQSPSSTPTAPTAAPSDRSADDATATSAVSSRRVAAFLGAVSAVLVTIALVARRRRGA